MRGRAAPMGYALPLVLGPSGRGTVKGSPSCGGVSTAVSLPPGMSSAGGLLARLRHDFFQGVGWRQRLSGRRLLLEFPNHCSKGPHLLSEGGDPVTLAWWRRMDRREALRLFGPHLLLPRQAGGSFLSTGYHHLFFGVEGVESLLVSVGYFLPYAPCCLR